LSDVDVHPGAAVEIAAEAPAARRALHRLPVASAPPAREEPLTMRPEPALPARRATPQRLASAAPVHAPEQRVAADSAGPAPRPLPRAAAQAADVGARLSQPTALHRDASPARPAVRLVARREAPPISSPTAPVTAARATERLAAVPGASVLDDGGGGTTVTFAAPDTPTIARTAEPPGPRPPTPPEPRPPTPPEPPPPTPPEAAPPELALPPEHAGDATAPPAHAAAPPSGAGATGDASTHLSDELYEQVVERLRRDLIVERERMGDLLGDLP
jgi:hypothetical protein